MPVENYESYQGVPVKETTDEVYDSDFSTNKTWVLLGRYKIIILAIALVSAISILSLASLSNRTFSQVVCASDESVTVATILGASQGGFCKTSCENACASFPSVYGNLCCEWTLSEEGDKSCQQKITKEGACLCGNEGATVPSTADGTPASVPAKIPVEVKKTLAPKEKRKDDDWDSGWAPFGGWEPMPGWTPFKPIKVPEGATECKKQCDHPCGWSQSDGHRVCCEKETDKDCSVTQINGKCYCG